MAVKVLIHRVHGNCCGFKLRQLVFQSKGGFLKQEHQLASFKEKNTNIASLIDLR